MAEPPVVTRFAPSPTGLLHVGGARTALFNWAFARRHGGTFILRIEDTDRVRSTVDSTRRIIEDLRWLGLDWDEGPPPEVPPVTAGTSGADWTANLDQIDPRGVGPFFQSQRLDIYREHVGRLIAAGRAYRCFKTPEQLAAERDAAKREKRAYKYDRTESANLSAEAVAKYEGEGRPCVVRFRMPDRDVTVHDEVLGDVTVRAAELEDFVVVKSDGHPTFHLANVVDDALMGVTHVLRGQEHLMNTPKHVALFEALFAGSDYTQPRYAHIPLIFNPDGSKMSKRDAAKAARAGAERWLGEHGNDREQLSAFIGQPVPMPLLEDFLDKKDDHEGTASSIAEGLGIHLPEINVGDFKRAGYLPSVLVNYLALLGWSPGGDVERFGDDPWTFLRERFSIDAIGKSNARFDRDKLLRFNTEAIAAMPEDVNLDAMKKHISYYHHDFYQSLDARSAFPLFARTNQPRSRTLEEPFDNGRFFVQADDGLVHDDKAVKKVLEKNNGEGIGVLTDLHPLLAECDPWRAERLQVVIENYATERGLGMGKVAQPLRLAVSGGTVSPPIFDTLEILGKVSTLNRIKDCVRRYRSRAEQATQSGLNL